LMISFVFIRLSLVHTNTGQLDSMHVQFGETLAVTE
jgi:hypothetical protein